MEPYTQFFDRIPPFHKTMSLDGMKALLAELDNFHLSLRVIHITGTNGKGSSAKMLSSIYHTSGYTTGVFTSPYIYDYRECITLNESMISIRTMNAVTAQIEEAYQRLESKHSPLPTKYECITTCALLSMYLKHVDIAIIETLMGGQNDATNVFIHPLATLFTSISLDHTEYLGSTLSAIASNKAGIIKPYSPVICNKNPDEVTNVIRSYAEMNHSPYYNSNRFNSLLWPSDSPSSLLKKSTLKGPHQLINLKGVLNTVEILNRHFPVNYTAVEKAMPLVNHPCRIERLNYKHLPFILDGSHNPEGIVALCSFLKTTYPDHEMHFIFGMLEDKDVRQAKSYIYSLAHHVYLLEPDNPRKLKSTALFALLSDNEKKKSTLIRDNKISSLMTDILPSVIRSDSLAKKEEPTKLFIVCGSLYIAMPFRNYLLHQD